MSRSRPALPCAPACPVAWLSAARAAADGFGRGAGRHRVSCTAWAFLFAVMIVIYNEFFFMRCAGRARSADCRRVGRCCASRA